jgi:hypothetical protein
MRARAATLDSVNRVSVVLASCRTRATRRSRPRRSGPPATDGRSPASPKRRSAGRSSRPTSPDPLPRCCPTQSRQPPSDHRRDDVQAHGRILARGQARTRLARARRCVRCVRWVKRLSEAVSVSGTLAYARSGPCREVCGELGEDRRRDSPQLARLLVFANRANDLGDGLLGVGWVEAAGSPGEVLGEGLRLPLEVAGDPFAQAEAELAPFRVRGERTAAAALCGRFSRRYRWGVASVG